MNWTFDIKDGKLALLQDDIDWDNITELDVWEGVEQRWLIQRAAFEQGWDLYAHNQACPACLYYCEECQDCPVTAVYEQRCTQTLAYVNMQLHANRQNWDLAINAVDVMLEMIRHIQSYVSE